MTSPSFPARLEAEARLDVADASGWFQSEKAQELLAKIDYLEKLSDTLTGYGLLGVAERAGDELSDLELELDNLRSAAVEEAQGLLNPLGDDSIHDDDACEDIENGAPSVSEAINLARRQRLGDRYLFNGGLAPMRFTSAHGVAA